MSNDIGIPNQYDGILASGDRNVFGWNSYSSIFNKLISQVRPSVIIEVGSWLGASAIHMAKCCRSLSLDTKIYCVDTWLGAEEFWNSYSSTNERNLKLKNGYPQVYFDFLANVVEHEVQDMIIPVPNTSHIGSMILQKRGVLSELIYIDGSHDYVDVLGDIKDYYKLLLPGGVMFGDDIGWDGVRSAVKDSNKKFEIYEDSFWVINASSEEN
jgi:hypothetical protein